MAPRNRLLDLEMEDVLFFSGDCLSVATHAIVFWPVFLAAALLLHLVAPFPHAAAVCAGLYGAYCFFLDRAALPHSKKSSSLPPQYSPYDGSLYDRAEFVSL